MWFLLDGVPIITVELPRMAGDPPIRGFCRQHAVVPALFATAERDLLHAALSALWAAAGAYGEHGYRHLFAEARDAFPALRGDGKSVAPHRQ